MAEGRNWKGWLKEPNFYIHGVVYMMIRIAINVTMTLTPFYIVGITQFVTTKENPTPYQLALVPMLSYIASMVFSIFIQHRLAFKNRVIPIFVGNIILMFSSLPLMFLNGESSVRIWIYPLFIIQGVGLAIILNTAT